MRDRNSVFWGLFLIVLGGLFLLFQFSEPIGRALGIELGWRLWPLFVLFAGLAFWAPILLSWKERRRQAGLAMPGMILTVNGLILLYQSLTGDWDSWAYLWTMEPIAVALGLLTIYFLGHQDKGLLVAASIVGGIGLFFFVIFASAFGGWLRYLIPLALILIGLMFLLRGSQERAANVSDREKQSPVD